MFIFSGGGTTRRPDLRPRRLLVEPLEERQLLSVDPVSIDVNTAAGGSATGHLSANWDGQFIAYLAGNPFQVTSHVGDDTNGTDDMFVRDMEQSAEEGITRVSTATGGDVTCDYKFSASRAISSDGQYVAFASGANLLLGLDQYNDRIDNNGCHDVFVKKPDSPTTICASTASDGTTLGNNHSYFPAMCEYILDEELHVLVAFESLASNLDGVQDTGGHSDIFFKDVQTDEITRVSVDTNGEEADGDSSCASIAAVVEDDEVHVYVAFASDATDLVNGDNNDARDVFVRDVYNQTTIRVSKTNSGGEATGGDSDWPAISADALYVAFQSDADNLLGYQGDTNECTDIFVRDWQAGTPTTTLVSRATGTSGTQGDGPSVRPAISADGQYVAFASDADNLLGVGNDTNDVRDVFVRYRLAQSPTTTRASTDSEDNEVTGASDWPVISAGEDYLYVAFQSLATDLVDNDGNGYCDIFVKDIAGETTRISTDVDGDEGQFDSEWPGISADGEHIVFYSNVFTLLTSSDTNASDDIFVKDDWQTETPTLNRVSTDSSGNQVFDPKYAGGVAINADDGTDDARYVVFMSMADNLVPGDTNGTADIFVKDRDNGTTTRVSTDSSGNQGNGISEWPAISATGRYVVFESTATNLVSGDTNGRMDVFRKDRVSGDTIRVSMSGSSQLNQHSCCPVISEDGRYVAYMSVETDAWDHIIDGKKYDIYLADLQNPASPALTRITNGDNGGGDGHSWWPVITPDGRYVAFYSDAEDLVLEGQEEDANGAADVFRWDRTYQTTKLVSTSSTGEQGTYQPQGVPSNLGSSSWPSISADGRYVAFSSFATNLVDEDGDGYYDDDTNNRWVWHPDTQTYEVHGSDIFVKDVVSGNIARVNRDADGHEAAYKIGETTYLNNNHDSYNPAFSGDGQYVAFESYANNLLDPVGPRPSGRLNVYRVMNPFTFVGTSGNDVFTYSNDGTSQYVSVTLAGQSTEDYTRPAAWALTFNGKDGQDQITINARPEDDDVQTYPTSATFAGSLGTYALTFIGMNQIEVNAGGGSGSHTASMHDADAFINTLYDTFTWYPGIAEMAALSLYVMYVSGFDHVIAYGSGDVGDTANLHDGAGNDTWVAKEASNYSEMSDKTWTGTAWTGTSTYFVRAEGFRTQNAYADGGGANTAYLYDTSGDDVFQAWGPMPANDPNVIMCPAGGGTTWQTYQFGTVYGYRQAGGYDTSYFHHSAGDPNKASFMARSYQGYIAEAVQNGPNYFYLASDFNEYWGYGNQSSNDEAYFRTTGGGDTVNVRPTYAELTGTVPGSGKQVYFFAAGFKKYFILRDIGDTSINNVVTLYGTSGNDTFTTRYDANGYPYCEMTLSNNVYYRVGYWSGLTRGFDKVYVDGAGGNDTANLYGSAANDSFWGHLGEAVLSDGTLDSNNGDRLTAGTYYYRLLGFGALDIVNVYGCTGTNNRTILNPIDYALAFFDTWTGDPWP